MLAHERDHVRHADPWFSATASHLIRTLQVSERMACRLAGLSRSAYRRPLKGDTSADPDRALRDWLRAWAKKLGIADAKAIIKAFAEPKVRKALKSRQWKVASSIAFNILKKTSPKIASFLIKKAAHSVLPGGAVGALAVAVGACALGEL